MRPETFEELLLEHLDGTLTDERRRAFEEYLRRHPDVQDRVRQHEELDRILGDLAEETTSPLVNGAAMRMSGAAGLAPRRRRAAAGWWLAAAAAVLLGAGLWWAGRRPDRAADDAPHVARPDPPAFLQDPEFLADLPVIFALSDLEAAEPLLDVADDAWMADVVALEVLDGA